MGTGAPCIPDVAERAGVRLGSYHRSSWRWLRILVIASVVLATVARPDPALGQEPGRATLTVLRGTVAVMRKDGTSVQPARTGLVMDVGDRVATVGRAGALITFFVGTEIEMGADTTLVLKELSGPRTTGNLVRGNSIGTDLTGTIAIPNGSIPFASGGIRIESLATGNTIGGTTGVTVGGPCTGACNLISGNGNTGLLMVDANTAQGNYIGTDVTGLNALPNLAGVILSEAAILGGNTPAARNIVSGNERDGVLARGTGFVIQGNYIGVNTQGHLLGNGIVSGTGHGIHIPSGSPSENGLIGGMSSGEGNTISGNRQQGIFIEAPANPNPSVRIFGNIIGLDPGAVVIKANQAGGIGVMAGSSGNVIGAPGSRNIISGNNGNGITLAAATTVRGNTIGPDQFGSDLANTGHGISISANDSTIGGAAAGQGNVLGFNGGVGIVVDCSPPPSCERNTFRANQVFQNHFGAIFIGGPDPNIQNGVTAPTLNSATASHTVNVTRAGCVPTCTVEAFDNFSTAVNDPMDQARTPLGTGTLTGPTGNVTVSGVIVAGHRITVTVTLSSGDTSAVSNVVTAT